MGQQVQLQDKDMFTSKFSMDADMGFLYSKFNFGEKFHIHKKMDSTFSNN